MVYIDTSVWVALLCFENKAGAIKKILTHQNMLSVCCSDWIRTELMSALSIKYRRGELDLDTLHVLHQTIDGLARNGSHWPTPLAIDFQTASHLCSDPNTKLRAGDALHLAIAKRLKCSQFFSLDDVLNANAQALGFRVVELVVSP
jgi:uncharacterized protein